MDDLARTQLRGRVPVPAGGHHREIRDPLEGPLPLPNGHETSD
jgi:hypothetical protein